MFARTAEAMARLSETLLDPVTLSVREKLLAPGRLAALEQTRLLDSAPEIEFDRITRLIKQLLNVDIALVSLVDGSRQFFKSQCGLPPPVSEERGTPLSHSFCQYVVASEEALVISDATQNAVLKTNGAVIDLNVIAYLGVPLRAVDGAVIGSLCAIHTTPRDWTADDKVALEEFAHLVQSAVIMRDYTRIAIAEAARSDILAKEYNHRVKNTMAIAASLVRLARRETNNIDIFARVLQDRFAAMTHAHDMLAHAGGDTPIRSVLERLLRPYISAQSDIHLDGPQAVLASEQVVPFCLAFHEFATNSAKYGAIRHDQALGIQWHIENAAFTVVWREVTQAVEAKTERPSGGFGNTLLQVAARQLSGTLKTEWDAQSLRHILTFPLLRAAA